MNRIPRILPFIALVLSMSLLLWSAAPVQAAPAADKSAGTDATAPAGSDAAAAPAQPPADANAPAAQPGTDTTAAPAATEPAATEPAATEPTSAPENANQSLNAQVDDFWHYGEVGRYDLQANIGKRLVAEGQQNPEELLKQFEQVAAQHRNLANQPTDLDTELLRWQAADPQMKQVASQVLDVLNKGRFARRQNQQYISQNIDQLAQGERAYMLAIQQLRNSGELAVPEMVRRLMNETPQAVQYHDVIRRALADLGREALNPLLAATQMNPRNLALTTICGVLGEIGYNAAGPYLIQVASNSQASAQVREAANIALRRLNVDPQANGGNLFYDLADKFYYGSAAIQPDPRSPKAFIWYWSTADNALTFKAVPLQIFNDIMAMRETEHALRLSPQQPDQAVALWLAANIRRGVDLPAGETDPTRGQTEPPPQYYNVAEGATYLNLVLDRSLKDNTPQSAAVALAAIKSLQEIVGQSNMFTGGRGQPLVEAMRSPDRQVRFEAAFAIAAALPQRPFQGQDRVVPLLAEAVSQNGTPGVLVIAPQNDRTRLAAEMKGYAVAGGTDPAAAIADSPSLPAVDVILMSEDLGNADIDRILDLAAQNPRLEKAAKVIIVHSLASPWARLAITDPTVTATQAVSGQPLLNAIEQARKKAGGLPMDEKVATDFALRAANLLARLAISRGQVLDLTGAQPQLLAALGDKRPQIATAVGEAVALLNSPQAQGALADRANDTGTPPDVRISFYKSLAISAKFNGNKLEAGQIDALRQVVMSEQNLDIRSAAAAARGALNLPAQDAKVLVTQRQD